MSSYVYVKNPNGKTYVYENTTYWDKESKSCKHFRKSIGHLDPDTGEIVPNYKKGDKQMKTSSGAAANHCIVASTGIGKLLDKAVSDIKLDAPLKAVFPDDWERILACAYYLVSGRMVLKEAPLPEDIRKLGVEGVNRIWRDAKLRGAGMKRAKTLVSAAEHSVGSKEAPGAARMELKNLLNDMDVYTSRLEELLLKIEEKLKEIPYVDKLMGIKGIGLVTVSGFIAEVGDIGRFDNPKQLQKLAGYAIVANDSGKHNGESRISYRGRKRLRYVLYEAAISLIGKNAEFRAIHEYYRTRKENPLKKMQSVVAVACKVLRIFYTILTKGVDYDAGKLMGDIRRAQIQAA